MTWNDGQRRSTPHSQFPTPNVNNDLGVGSWKLGVDAFQNLNFAANCQFRCGSEFPYAVCVIRPTFVFKLPGTPISESGFPRFTWLNRLTTSTRSSMSRSEPSGMCLKSDASTRQYPGPRR